MTEKTFAYAVVSTNARGVTKFRFSNNGNYQKTLARDGHTNITVYELDEPMTKAEAQLFLMSKGHDEVEQDAALDAITDTVEEVFEDAGFVEPTDEATQVLMCRLAARRRDLSAAELLAAVLSTHGG
jgi:hypothetical protein